MSASIIIGSEPTGAPVHVDIEELLATRLLVQGNSGSGKSHLLRRLLEESATLVQQVVIDPEGDFVTLAEEFGHVVIDGSAYAGHEIARLAARVRRHRASTPRARSGTRCWWWWTKRKCSRPPPPVTCPTKCAG